MVSGILELTVRQEPASSIHGETLLDTQKEIIINSLQQNIIVQMEKNLLVIFHQTAHMIQHEQNLVEAGGFQQLGSFIAYISNVLKIENGLL